MTRIRATKCLAAGDWQTDPIDTITLNKDQRHRRRIAMTSDAGLEFLLDLPEARELRHGDGLQLEDGRVIKVAAEPEELLEVRGQSNHHLLELAWHRQQTSGSADRRSTYFDQAGPCCRGNAGRPRRNNCCCDRTVQSARRCL